MRYLPLKPVSLIVIGSLLLAACTAPIGVLAPKATTAPGLSGTAGPVKGQPLAEQEAALRASLSSGNALVTNSGAALTVTLPGDLLFDSGSAVIRPAVMRDIDALAANLIAYPDSTVDVFGHTDNIGAAFLNQQLSAERARAVMTALFSAGVAQDRLHAIGRGEASPVVTNLTEAGRAQNRRIEVVIRPVP